MLQDLVIMLEYDRIKDKYLDECEKVGLYKYTDAIIYLLLKYDEPFPDRIIDIWNKVINEDYSVDSLYDEIVLYSQTIWRLTKNINYKFPETKYKDTQIIIDLGKIIFENRFKYSIEYIIDYLEEKYKANIFTEAFNIIRDSIEEARSDYLMSDTEGKYQFQFDSYMISEYAFNKAIERKCDHYCIAFLTILNEMYKNLDYPQDPDINYPNINDYHFKFFDKTYNNLLKLYKNFNIYNLREVD